MQISDNVHVSYLEVENQGQHEALSRFILGANLPTKHHADLVFSVAAIYIQVQASFPTMANTLDSQVLVSADNLTSTFTDCLYIKLFLLLTSNKLSNQAIINVSTYTVMRCQQNMLKTRNRISNIIPLYGIGVWKLIQSEVIVSGDANNHTPFRGYCQTEFFSTNFKIIPETEL